MVTWGHALRERILGLTFRSEGDAAVWITSSSRKWTRSGKVRASEVSRNARRGKEIDFPPWATAGLDGHARRARVHASAPGGMQQVSHRGE